MPTDTSEKGLESLIVTAMTERADSHLPDSDTPRVAELPALCGEGGGIPSDPTG
ncbi:MAG: hypothetical protein AAB427_13235 [Chloroflexota bacterium]